jgi:ABC-type glycerol-3-phosphate transport system permease component
MVNMILGTNYNFMTMPQAFRTIYIASGIWQGAGWASIIYTAALSNASKDLKEAAVIDGASPFGLFFRIVMPLMKPVLVTVMVLTFLNTWNEFVMPLYFLGSTDKWPMTLAVYNFFGMYFKDWNLVCADIVLTSLPVIVVYLLGQKYIVSGMTAGAVKG